MKKKARRGSARRWRRGRVIGIGDRLGGGLILEEANGGKGNERCFKTSGFSVGGVRERCKEPARLLPYDEAVA